MFSELLAESSRSNLQVLLLIWLTLVGVLMVAQWRSRWAVGLPLAYVFGMSLIHFFSAGIYSLAYYTPRSDILVQGGYSLANTYVGFRLATIGLAGFVAGTLLFPLIFRAQPRVHLLVAEPQVTTKLPGTLLLISILSFFIIAPVLRRVPSLGSLGNSGTSLSVVALFMFSWIAFQRRDTKQFLGWLLCSFVFPLVTIVFLGFASFGAVAATTVWMMVLRFYRPRWIGVIALVFVVYGSLTLYINWMGERDAIRDAVWGERSISVRLERLRNMFNNFQMFDAHKQLHLELVDLRLNQNDLAGKAWFNLERGRVKYTQGYTVWVALTAWVPRILWPGKPVTGGGGDVVTYFTGQKFAEGTSVGAGQVLEFYGNFGVAGDFFGFALLALLIRFFDMRAGFYLAGTDFWNSARWLLPGLAMLQPGGSLAEIVGTVAANSVFVLVLHHQVFKKYYYSSRLAEQARLAPQRGRRPAGRVG